MNDEPMPEEIQDELGQFGIPITYTDKNGLPGVMPEGLRSKAWMRWENNMPPASKLTFKMQMTPELKQAFDEAQRNRRNADEALQAAKEMRRAAIIFFIFGAIFTIFGVISAL